MAAKPEIQVLLISVGMRTGAQYIQGQADITKYVKSATIRESINAPYQTIDLSIVHDFDGSIFQANFYPGYIEVHHPDAGLLARGIIQGWTSNERQHGPSRTISETLRCVGWADLLMQAHMHVDPNMASGQIIGTCLALEEFQQLLTFTLSAVGTQEPVNGLETLFVGDRGIKGVARIAWPSGGGSVSRLCDRVTVRSRSLPSIGYAASPVPGLVVDHVSNSLRFGGSVWGTIAQTFQFDTELVELFPITSRSGSDSLAYRMKPNRVLDGTEFLTQRVGAASASSHQRNTRAGDDPNLRAAANARTFGGPVWGSLKAGASVIKKHEVMELNQTHDLGNNVTAVTAGSAGTPDPYTLYYKVASLPITSVEAANWQGFRLYRPSWPFMPGLDKSLTTRSGRTQTGAAATRTLADYNTWLVGLATEAAQTMLDRSVFATGSVKTHFNPGLRAGKAFGVETAQGAYVSNIDPTGVTSLEFDQNAESKTSYGYATGVSHSFSIAADGRVTATTSVEFDRFLPWWLEGQRHSPLSTDDYPGGS